MGEQYLWHVTLTSGHTCRQQRATMDAEALARVSGLLAEALAGAEPEVRVGYTVRATASGTNLIAALMAGAAPILTTGVALRSRSAPGLWRRLHDTADPALGPLATSRNDAPRAPWIADRIERGMALALHTGGPGAVPHWTGAWSALVGWAWMEMMECGR